MNKAITYLLPIFLFIFILPIVLLAAETKPDFVPLVGIPGIDTNSLSTTEYINALYILAMSVAAFIAVVKLIIAGLKYIMSDVVTNKESAKKDIKNSILGLLIVFGAVLILETINPQLKRLDFLRNAPASDLVRQKYQTGGSCSNFRINPNNGQKLCLDDLKEGEECDKSLAGGICGCNEAMRTITQAPGIECVPIKDENDDDKSESTCEFEIDNNCPCGQRAVQITAGNVECEAIPGSEVLKWDFNGLSFEEARAIDRNTEFVVNEPALPEYGLEAGEFHGQSIQMVQTGEVCRFEEGDTSCTQIAVTLPNGNVGYLGCDLILPRPIICGEV